MTALLECIADRLAILVADCPTFRTLVGAADRDAALARIHIPDALDTGEHPLPRAIINTRLGRLDEDKIGVSHWIIDGDLVVSFEMPIPDATLAGVSYADIQSVSHRYVANTVGEIISEMRDLAGTGEGATGETHLNAITVGFDDTPDAYVQEETLVTDPNAVPLEWFANVRVRFR